MAVQLLDQIAWVAKRFGGQALLVAAAPRTASMRGAARDDPRSAHLFRYSWPRDSVSRRLEGLLRSVS